ncbi:ankyrin [Penicillium cataractarum]|uniref:Ankyrin n=1 Tax=Penicillium cataractarum TaxID=2100454 RepID=A0A9W9RVN6_9EURO|nr:ankyrin [Penicillium cataractarum]KAJ5364693.1 ankyrin [Penicillium cataractarum]
MVNPGWDLYKSEIERLYIHENKTRAEVMRLMATKYSWNKTKRIDKRKREDDKDSEVFVNGLQIHPTKIARSSYRNGFLTEYSRRGPSPSTPEGHVVATPTSAGIRIFYSNFLPWIRFTRLFQPSEDDDNSPSSELALNSSRNGKAVARGMNFELMQHLSTLIPWTKLQHRLNMHSSSRTSAALSILMPEKEPGQHDILSTALSTSRAGSQECLSVVLYLISNNLTSRNSEGFYEAIERNDKLVLKILSDTGWDDLEHLKILLSAREPTAESITEKLFAAAVRQHNFDIVQNMLRSGMNPNGLIENLIVESEETFCTPLQYIAATDESAHAIKLFTSHNADVNFSVNNDGKNALYYAIITENETSIRILLAHGATVTQECVRSATAFRPDDIKDFRLIENIIDIYFDQDVARERDYTNTLKLAVMRNNVSIVERFLAKGADLNGLLRSYFPSWLSEHQTTLLGYATNIGNIEIVRLLLHVSVRKDPSLLRPPYISPLAIAAGKGFIDICELLLSSGADNRAADEGENTLLERAVPKNNLALCQLLINHGFKIDREPRETQPCPSALMIAVQKRLVDIVNLLISSNARLNDVFDMEPGSILAAAVEVGDEAIINNLISVGARWIGLGVSRICNLQTAIFLQNNGFLSELVDHSGPKLLAAAISAQDDGLAWFLLHNNAHQQRKKPTLVEETPLLAALQVNNVGFVLALLERGAQVTDDALTEAVKDNVDLLPTLLAGFTGSAPTAVSAAVLNASRIGLDLLREANVALKGVP